MLFPPNADIRPRNQDASFANSGHRQSFDYLVRSRKQRRWHAQAERLGSLKGNYEIEFAGLHHRRVGWPLALQDPSGEDVLENNAVVRVVLLKINTGTIREVRKALSLNRTP